MKTFIALAAVLMLSACGSDEVTRTTTTTTSPGGHVYVPAGTVQTTTTEVVED